MSSGIFGPSGGGKHVKTMHNSEGVPTMQRPDESALQRSNLSVGTGEFPHGSIALGTPFSLRESIMYSTTNSISRKYIK